MRDRPDALMVFAAGFGTRMRPLTDDRPKPLIRVGGRTLLDRALDLGREAGVARIAVNAHYRAEMIEAHLAGTGVTVLREDPILETGGGLKAALPALGAGAVLTLNPDGVFAGPNPLSLLREGWTGGEGALLLVARREAAGRAEGDFDLSPDGTLRRGGDWVYLGAQALSTGAVARRPDGAFSLNEVWDGMAARGDLRGLRYPGRWADVGTPEGIAAAEALLEAADVRAV